MLSRVALRDATDLIYYQPVTILTFYPINQYHSNSLNLNLCPTTR